MEQKTKNRYTYISIKGWSKDKKGREGQKEEGSQEEDECKSKYGDKRAMINKTFCETTEPKGKQRHCQDGNEEGNERKGRKDSKKERLKGSKSEGKKEEEEREVKGNKQIIQPSADTKF